MEAEAVDPRVAVHWYIHFCPTLMGRPLWKTANDDIPWGVSLDWALGWEAACLARKVISQFVAMHPGVPSNPLHGLGFFFYGRASQAN
jgi:hypothetical protein